MSTLTLIIDEELKKEFKKVCIEKNVTQTEVLKELVKKYIEENKDKK